jgi:chromosome segregation ATPase
MEIPAMSETGTTARPSSTTWIPWVAALLGFSFQIIWFSSQFGSLSARIEESERRVAAIEQNGSPAVQAIRTEVSINSRRIANLEDQYFSKVSMLLTDNAAHNERLNNLQSEVESLRQWRLTHVGEDGNVGGRVAALDRRLQQFEAAQAALEREVAAMPHPRPRP